MKPGDFADLTFARDLLSANHADGKAIHFTRQERALLFRLVNNPGRLLRRDVLIDAINADGGEPASDRHIDFLINQLRRKLGDDARRPRFIRTQYGEGYVWVGDVALPSDAPPALLRLGAIYGAQAPGGSELVDSLCTAIAGRLAPAQLSREGDGAYTLDLSLHDNGPRLQAALVLRDGATAAILDTFRIAMPTNDDAAAIAAIADAVAHTIWSSAALPTRAEGIAPGEAPPWVRLFEAALMMDGDMLTWKSNAERLATILANEPDNAVMEVMRGLNLYTQLIQSLFDPNGQQIDAAQWQVIEDDIETIALAALSRFDDQPVMQMAAAKLLIFINRGYLHLARRIADDALANSTAHAAAFALCGEAAGHAGDIEEAAYLLERAFELSEAGSQFRTYLLVIEATALFASGDQAAFERICQLTRDVAPDAYETLRAFCGLPGYEMSPLFTFVIARDPERAREAVRFLWNVSGRHFALRSHRRNVMYPMTAALVSRYGLGIVPDDVDLGTGLRAELAKELALVVP